MFKTMRVVSACTLVLAGAPGQTVWNVTTKDGIQPAITAASPGDVLVLTANNGFPDYYPFTLDKGLTIRGNGARVGGSPASRTYLITIAVPPGQVAHLDGLDCTYGYSPLGSLGCRVVVQSGTVRLEECRLLFGNGDALQISNAEVAVVNSTVTSSGNIGSGRGIAASNARVTLRDCTVAGANSTCHPFAGCVTAPGHALPAIDLVGSTLHAERVIARGGSHVTSAFNGNGAPAVLAASSTVFLADSNLTGGSSINRSGAAALVNTGTTPIALRQTQLTGGSPGGGGSSGPVDLTAPLVRLALVPPWARGVTSTLSFAGDAGAVYGLWLATDVTSTTVSLVSEPVWLLSGAPIVIGRLDRAGNAALPVAVPNVAALQHVTVWCQGLSGLQFPLRVTTIAGGVIH